jgi:hypothetical protein
LKESKEALVQDILKLGKQNNQGLLKRQDELEKYVEEMHRTMVA